MRPARGRSKTCAEGREHNALTVNGPLPGGLESQRMLRASKPNRYTKYIKNQRLSVSCGVTYLAEGVESKLSNAGFHIDHTSLTNLVLDLPPAYGTRFLERLPKSRRQVIMVTWNPCKEHAEDLWEL